MKLEGDGLIDRAALQSWVACRDRSVRLVYDAEERITLLKLIVVPDVVGGQVAVIDPEGRTITLSDRTIAVVDAAVILKLEGEQLQLVEMDALKANDDVTFFGVAACGDDSALNDFYAFVLAVE